MTKETMRLLKSTQKMVHCAREKTCLARVTPIKRSWHADDLPHQSDLRSCALKRTTAPSGSKIPWTWWNPHWCRHTSPSRKPSTSQTSLADRRKFLAWLSSQQVRETEKNMAHAASTTQAQKSSPPGISGPLLIRTHMVDERRSASPGRLCVAGKPTARSNPVVTLGSMDVHHTPAGRGMKREMEESTTTPSPGCHGHQNTQETPDLHAVALHR